MINLFLFLALMFALTYLVGRFVEKFRVPWIFAALLIGSLLSINNPFSTITESQNFVFLAKLGMYLLLFMIGFEINIRELRSEAKFLIKSTFFIIFFEAFLGSLIIHFVFGYSWLLALLVALSFATVGEAVLIPILDEFKVTRTKLGQFIISIGSLDDIIEVLTLIIAVFMLGYGTHTNIHISMIITFLFLLFMMTFFLTKLKREGEKFKFTSVETLFFITITVFFLFLGIGEFAEATSLAALLAGLGLKIFLPKERLKLIENEIRALGYGLFAPIFFLWVGLSVNFDYILKFPLLILLVVLVSNSAKLLSSYVIMRKKLGTKGSLLLGLGLSVRFSTSIVIIKLLLDYGLIGQKLFSVIIASSIIFKFLIPLLFANLLVKWGFAKSVKNH